MAHHLVADLVQLLATLAGDLRLDLDDDDSIQDAAGNPLGGTGLGLALVKELAEAMGGRVAVESAAGRVEDLVRLVTDRLAAQGKAVIIVSSELPELLGMSDRIVVIYEGQFAGERSIEEANVEELGLMMAGSKISGSAVV